jgi:hypothetical protein
MSADSAVSATTCAVAFAARKTLAGKQDRFFPSPVVEELGA